MHVRTVKCVVLLAAVAALSACESTSGVKEDQGVGQPSTEQLASSAATAGAAPGSTSGFQGSPLDDPSSLLSTRVVYFDYDVSDVRPDERAIVEAHGSYLASNPDASVTLEGHADERGSREYNIALGERRGNSVRQLMTLLGASAAQIRVVSYGEERPAVEGHDESAWSQNRRVEIIYRSR